MVSPRSFLGSGLVEGMRLSKKVDETPKYALKPKPQTEIIMN